MENEKKYKLKSSWIKKQWLLLSVIFIMIILGLTGYSALNKNKNIDLLTSGNVSTVTLDVNPSIEIKVNEQEKVVEVNALNEDAKKVLDGMKLKDTDLNVTVNALIGSLLKNGYINEITNSILVTVENEDIAKADTLRKKLTEEINTFLGSDIIHGSIVSQTIVENSEIKDMAANYTISEGKANLIKSIVKQNSLLNEVDLAKLSITELNLLYKGEDTAIKTEGTASVKGYIGEEKAREIVINHSKVNSGMVKNFRMDFDYDYNAMTYDISFKSEGKEYDYEIDAKTGDIMEYDVENDNEYFQNNTNSNSDIQTSPNTSTNTSNVTMSTDSYISNVQAKSIALTHAGVAESLAREMEIDFDYEAGVRIYEVNFKAGNYEYEYDINAITGKIIKNYKEIDD
ncbi:MAG: PepSY domain-containing protein [Lachnospiraceae bacterium]|jgi:uncharacterized membrane protein YkoI|nr:PepSY domain-containing protein [Lachnospiraceae bacterium]